MEDIHNWYRIIGLYVALHIILFCVEWHKYRHSTFSWYGFSRDGMYWFTYLLIFVDLFLMSFAILLWALWPLLSYGL